MNSKTFYIYPTYNPEKDTSGNLYIKHFANSFHENGYLIKNRNGKFGIVSLLLNLNSNIFIFNWVDLIPFKRFGEVQSFLFIISLFVLKLFKKKIVWVLHNKKSHHGDSVLVSIIMRFMARFADVVIVHSKEGVQFFNEKYSDKYGHKAYHIPHPIYQEKIFKSKKVLWDYIIWGGIGPHKNVHSFLEYVEQSPILKEKKILICGKCSDLDYANKIESKLSKNITFINRFISDKELKNHINSSKCILFTYNPESVLSSGALIYSLNFNKRIIAKNVGNFKDLKGIVDCYDSFEDIVNINIDREQNIEKIQDYLKQNTWSNFPLKVKSLI